MSFIAAVPLIKLAFSGFFESRKRKEEIKQEVHQAKVKRIRDGDESAATMDEMSAANRGWKDEYLMLIITLPLVLCFIPDASPHIKTGFLSLKASVPEWYMWLLLGVYIDTFGFRRILRNALSKVIDKRLG